MFETIQNQGWLEKFSAQTTTMTTDSLDCTSLLLKDSSYMGVLQRQNKTSFEQLQIMSVRIPYVLTMNNLIG